MNTYMIDYRDCSKPTKYKKYRIKSKTLRARSAQSAVDKFRATNQNEITNVLVPVGDLVCGFAQCFDLTTEAWS